MKKILSIVILSFCFGAVKAQVPKIHIEYDDNGNRIVRYYTPNRPAPPEDSSIVADSNIVISNVNDSSRLVASFHVYPNPSSDDFNIAVDEGMFQNGCEITLTDQLGKVQLRQKLIQMVTTISTRQLADGVYYINLNDNKAKHNSVRVVKMAN